MLENAIVVNGVSKVYNIYDDPKGRLKEMLQAPLARLTGSAAKTYHHEFHALRNLSFSVRKGESVGIIGKNGAGKSTLLSILAGTVSPTSGEVMVNGKVAALLELGSGFNPEFTGIENVYLNGSILGFNREFIKSKLDEILAFADIGEFVGQPVKTYSSGMMMRLAFAVQACLEPDVLIVDEALGVGDIFFQLKCHARMEKLQQAGTTILFVTHSMGSIEKYCQRAIVLNTGEMVFEGETSEAIGLYYNMDDHVARRREIGSDNARPMQLQSQALHDSFPVTASGWPDAAGFIAPGDMTVRLGDEGSVQCVRVGLFNSRGLPVRSFKWLDTMSVYAEFAIKEGFGVPIIGLSILDSRNILIYAKNSLMHGIRDTAVSAAGERIRIQVDVPLDLPDGEYALTLGVNGMDEVVYRHADVASLQEIGDSGRSLVSYNVASFVVQSGFQGLPPFFGLCNLKSSMTVRMA